MDTFSRRLESMESEAQVRLYLKVFWSPQESVSRRKLNGTINTVVRKHKLCIKLREQKAIIWFVCWGSKVICLTVKCIFYFASFLSFLHFKLNDYLSCIIASSIINFGYIIACCQELF